MWRSDDGIGRRLAAVLPALALGLGAGVAGGIVAAGVLDSTPYDSVQFNTASRNAREAGKAQGIEQARRAAERQAERLTSAYTERVSGLKDELAKTRKTFAKRESALLKKQRQSREREARLESRLAEKTAALANATGEGSGPDAERLEGTVRSTWTFGRKEKPWPDGCAQALDAYEVRVIAGGAVTVVPATLVDAEVVKRDERKDVLTLACKMTYTADLPAPLGSGYRVVVEDSENGGKSVTEPVSDGALGRGAGPLIWVER